VCNENEKLEKENADLRRQVSDMQQLLSALPDPVRMSLGGSQHSERMDARRRLVSSILDAFNCGALDRLTRIMDEVRMQHFLHGTITACVARRHFTKIVFY
jgi:hypothetical protein